MELTIEVDVVGSGEDVVKLGDCVVNGCLFFVCSILLRMCLFHVIGVMECMFFSEFVGFLLEI